MTPRHTRLALILLAALATACQPDAADARADVPRPVLLICLDTVRADHMGAYGYERRPTTPALDALAARGLVFEDITAASGWTKPSVPSFLTGTWPALHGVYEGSARRRGVLTSDVLGSASRTLAERFAAEGYATAAFVRNAQLRTGLGFEQGFELYKDEAGDARQIVDGALEWLDGRTADDERPFFLYLHILDAHWPYDVPDEAATQFGGADLLAEVRGDDWRAVKDAIDDGSHPRTEELVAELLDLYDGSLRYVDDHLGRLFADLDRRGLTDELVVSVVADHGEDFLEHGRLGHGHGLYETLTRVGWLLAGPDVPAGRRPLPASLIDLYPTLLAAAGLEDDAPALGWAVDRLAHPERPAPVFAEHKAPDAYLQSLRDGDLKLVRRFEAPARTLDEAGPLGLLGLSERWEAEVRQEPDGRLLATQLKPRDGDDGDPLELKGLLTAVDGPRLALLGRPVLLGPEVQLSGSLASLDDLRVGALVKLKVEQQGDELVVLKAKGYDPGTGYDDELRGTVTRVEEHGAGRCTFWFGPVPVAVDGATDWEDLPEGRRIEPDLSREDVAVLLQLGGEAAVEAGFRVVHRLYDLSRDPLEQAPLVEHVGRVDQAPDDVARLAGRLDQLGRRLAALRLWDDGEGQALDAGALDDLRALGYVR